jgi:hypothetical protein
MAYLIPCPKCQRQLRIQESYAGTNIACPACDTVFLAPPPPIEAAFPAAEPVESGAGEGYWIDPPHKSPPLDMPELRRRPSRKRQRARQSLLPPAIIMIVAGSLGFLVHAADGVERLVRGGLDEADQARAKRLNMNDRLVHSMQMLCAGGFLLGNAYVILAGIYMLKLQSHPFVLSAAYVTMIPFCTGVGCFPGLVAGIWSLVLLYNSEIRSAFR